jgi:hypothetical protein
VIASRWVLLWLLFALVGCREPAPVQAPSPPSPPLVVGTSDAGASKKAETSARADAGAGPARIPASLIHLVEPDEQRVLLGPFAWPPKGTSAFVGQLSSAFIWKSDLAEDRDVMPTDRTPVRAVMKDVDFDLEPELVVFLAPLARPLEPFEDPSTMWIFGVRPRDHRVSRMSALEYQVMGASDERTLDSELSTLGILGPIANVPIERIVTRLRWATADELRALAPAKGIQECHRQATKRTCTTVARAAIDAKTTKRLVAKPGAFATYVADEMTALQRPACEETGKKITCSASVGGPEGGQWIFERRGADLELVEIGSWAEDS